MAFKCAGCLHKIPNREYLSCLLCQEKYDLQCANVSIQRFLNTMTKDHKTQWKCHACRSKVPKKDNSNTPIRPSHQSTSIDKEIIPESFEHHIEGISSQNVTMFRSNRFKSYDNNISSSEDELDTLGDTVRTKKSKKKSQIPLHALSNTVTLVQIEALLDRKLENIKTSLLSELKSTIVSVTTREITKLKTEISETINTLQLEQKSLKEDLEKVNKMITELNLENNKLKAEMNYIQTKLCDDNMINQRDIEYAENNYKKIVLYGLIENKYENECDVYDRVVNIFQDIYNINLTGYIEDMKRLGKQIGRRPLVIELLTKNLTKNILQNRHYFKRSGLAVSELLGPESLQTRKKLIEILIDFRKKGHRANIINNKLFIDGKEYKPQEYTSNSNNNSTTLPQSKIQSNTNETSQNNSDHRPLPSTTYAAICSETKKSTPNNSLQFFRR